MSSVNYNLPGAYQAQQLDAENAYQQALTSIAQRQASLAHDTGFTYQQQDDGSVSNVQIDPNNQYSNVMGLLASHADSLHSLRNDLAGRGLGNTGLAAKRAALLKFVQSGQTAGLGSAFVKNLAGLQSEKAGALNTKNQQFTAAEQSALLYALQNQQFNTAPGASITTPAGNQTLSEILGPTTGPYQGNAADVGPNGAATPGAGTLGTQIYGDPARPAYTDKGQTVQPLTYNSVGATPTPIVPGIVQPPIPTADPILAQAKKAGNNYTGTATKLPAYARTYNAPTVANQGVTPQSMLIKTVAQAAAKVNPRAYQVARNSY